MEEKVIPISKYVFLLKGTAFPRGWINLHDGLSLDLRKINKKKARCLVCKCELKAGEGVYQKVYRHNGFLCLPHAKNTILVKGAKGFRINILEQIELCSYDKPLFSAQEVVDSITAVRE